MTLRSPTLHRDPPWLAIARQHLGVAEIPGRGTAPVIARWLRELRAWWTDDETPWCGTYVAAVLREAGQPLPRHWYRARAWLEWGVGLREPAPGAIVVYERSGGGHVGFLVAEDVRGRLLTLGGNQGNRVSIAPFERARVLGYRWPEGRVAELVAAGALPVQRAEGASSLNEA